MFSLSDDRFELLRQVGEGGFGVVYEARDRTSDRRVAVKLLQEIGRVADGRFEREATLLADIRHPSVVRYIAHGRSSSGHNYLVMEWLEGQTLETRLKLELLSVAEVLTLAQRVVSGLAFAEQRGVVHRDIKPANLFLVGNDVGATKILDLGLARRIHDSQKLTRTGGIVGTAFYMSPEQARGERDVDPRSDVFSLGAVLYECLCNDLPFEGSHAVATLAKICMEEPVPIEVNARHVPPRFASLVHSMLQKARDKRPSYRAIAQTLDELASVGVNHASSDELPKRRPRGFTETQELSPSEQQRESLRQKSEQRVLCAIFTRGVGAWTHVLDHELEKVAQRLSARRERLLEGSQILLLDGHRSASDQAIISAQCALALSKLVAHSLPIAICTGRARVAAEQPLLGELLERGVRLLWDTPEGVIKVDDASAALLETRFELSGEAGQRALLRERPSGEAPRTLLGQPTRFLGRERELSQLELLFRDCVDEQVARPALVTAPAGGGKSRLRYELVERLKLSGTPFCLLIARGDATRARTQFGVLAPAIWAWAGLTSDDSLRVRREKLASRIAASVTPTRAASLTYFLGEMIGVPFAGELTPHMRAASVDPPLMSEGMLESFLEWLEALSADRPILLCVEDLHWSDPASVRFLDAALRSLAARPLMVLAFARPEVREQFPDLWSGRDLTELRLPKLTPRSCEKLLDTMLTTLVDVPIDAALRSWLVERADGNPFFLEELVRGLKDRKGHEGLPDSILGIVQARLDALGDELKLVVRAASVFGQQFNVAAVRELLGSEHAVELSRLLALLTEREVIFPLQSGAHEYGFRHALLRDAAYHLLESDECTRAHRLAADWLEQHGASPAVLAEHCERGGVRERAVRHYYAAATASLEAGSMDDVVRCGERAISCGAAGQALGEVAALLAEAHSYQHRDAASIEWSGIARANLPTGSSAWWRAAQNGAVADVRLGRERSPLVLEIIALTHEPPVLPNHVSALADLGGECIRMHHEALGQLLLALLPAEDPDAPPSRAYSSVQHVRSCQALELGDLTAAQHHARAAVRASRALGSLRDISPGLAQTGFILYLLGANADAEANFLESRKLAARVDLLSHQSYANLYLGLIQLRRGSLAEAEPLFHEAERGYRELNVPALHAEGLIGLAHVAVLRDDLQSAEMLLTKVMHSNAPDGGVAAIAYTIWAKLELRRGRPEQALARSQQALACMRSDRLQESHALTYTAHIDCLIACERRHEARVVLAEAKAWLCERADKVEGTGFRQSFLSGVPENVRLAALEL